VEEAPTYRNALPLKSRLLEYRLESVLGAGGFGMTYLGWDTNLEKNVAIKEYLPGELAVRALDGSVVPVNTEHEYNYKWGLDRFIQEARTLARFSHPSIVRVNRFLEANGTSYMVMDYEAGESLSQYLRRVAAPDEATLKSILMPILDGLQAVHQAGFLHRDIKPSNVFMRENGAPLLIDFGAARLTSSGVTKSMTAIVTPGYAPLEQYMSTGNQGPWTDVYALSGVMYRAVTGENPPDAVSRMKTGHALHALAAARPRYSERFLKAIEWGMVVDEKMRPQSIAEWRDLFVGRAITTAVSHVSPAAVKRHQPMTQVASIASPRQMAMAGHTVSKGNGGLLAAGGIAVLAITLGMSWAKRPPGPEPQAAAATVAMPEQRLPTPFPPSAAAPVAVPFSAGPGIETSPAPTHEADAGGDSPVPPQVKQEFELADSNGDGFLAPEEVKGRFPFVERNFSLVDNNHDGRISLSEFYQLRRKQHVQRPQ
jgi:serine/threonine protein kinase